MVEIFQDSSGEYRWRLKAKNGEIVATSAESYTRLRDVRRALRKLAWWAATAKMVAV